MKTTDHREALRLVKIAAVEVDQRFEDHRRKLSRPAQHELTKAQLQMIHDAYCRMLLEEDEENRLQRFEGFTAAKSFDEASAQNHELAKVTKREYAQGHVDAFIWSEAEDVLSWDGVDIELTDNSPSWDRVCRTIQEATLKARKAIQLRYEGEIVPTPIEATQPKPEPHSSPLLSALFSERQEEAKRTNRWSSKLIEYYENWTSLFIEVQGDRPITINNLRDSVQFKLIRKPDSFAHIRLSLVPKLPSKASTNLGAPQST